MLLKIVLSTSERLLPPVARKMGDLPSVKVPWKLLEGAAAVVVVMTVGAAWSVGAAKALTVEKVPAPALEVVPLRFNPVIAAPLRMVISKEFVLETNVVGNPAFVSWVARPGATLLNRDSPVAKKLVLLAEVYVAPFKVIEMVPENPRRPRNPDD